MTAFLASYRNEWHKLIIRKKYKVFLGLGVGICIFGTILGVFISNLAVRRFGSVSLALAPTPMGALPFFLQVLIPFLMFMGLTDLLTMEGAENAIKAVLCRPVERWKLYASKIVAVITYAAVYLACVYIISAVSNQVFGKALKPMDLFIAFASYALTLIPLTVLACFAAFIALLGRSGTLTMLLMLLFYLVFKTLPIFFPVTTEILFTSYLSWYRLWIGYPPGISKSLQILVTVLGYGVVFFTAGSLLFDRKDY
ncbi:MAG: ABC transporter permease subunit [Peptococcaceae bacterium]|jgi:ABC-2 type transport system permease protein|nr:ABC transporter permease subunit [Peptococcaceae bacterium]